MQVENHITLGLVLPEPDTRKHTTFVESWRVRVAGSSMQGWRTNNEDAHTHLLELEGDKDSMFFGVFDGHGGPTISQYASENLHSCILEQDKYKDDIKDAITKGFMKLDAKMQENEDFVNEMSGTTAVTVLMRGNTLYCGNCGDSRAVASINGNAVALSFDHKPTSPEEQARIEKAGGFVEYGRVNGSLALSRALGDYSFKGIEGLDPSEQMVSCCPEIIEKTVTDRWEFFVLACDGIWDVLSNQDAIDFIGSRLAKGHDPDQICEDIMMKCVSPDCSMGGIGCDNMTVIIVCLLNGKSFDSLVDRCAQITLRRTVEREYFQNQAALELQRQKELQEKEKKGKDEKKDEEKKAEKKAEKEEDKKEEKDAK